MIQKFLKSFIYAGLGFYVVLKEEVNFRLQVAIGIIILLAAFYFHFTYAEWVAIIVAVTLVLLSEIVNTAIEDLCNKIQPNPDPIIRKVKNTMAAFVLVSSVGALFLGFLTIIHHFHLFS
jgi:diacylglycerol kinase